MNRRTFQHLWSLGLALALFLGGASLHAQSAEGPDQLIKRLSTDVLDTIKTDKDVQSGDVRKIVTFVDAKVMPHVNFTRMTASAVGRNWRQATPEQQKILVSEVLMVVIQVLVDQQLQLVCLAVVVEAQVLQEATAQVLTVVRGVVVDFHQVNRMLVVVV